MKCAEMWALALSRMNADQKASAVSPPFAFQAPNCEKAPTKLNSSLTRFIEKRLKGQVKDLVVVKKSNDTLLPVLPLQLCWVNTMKMLYLLGEDAERDGWESRLMWDIYQDAFGHYRGDSHAVLYNTRTKTYLDFTRYGADTQERWLVPDTLNTRKWKVADMANKHLSDADRVRHIECKEGEKSPGFWDADRARMEADSDALQVVSDLTHNTWMVATLANPVESEKFRAVIRKYSNAPTTILVYESRLPGMLVGIRNTLSSKIPNISKCGDGKTYWGGDGMSREESLRKLSMCEALGFKVLDYSYHHLLVLPGLEKDAEGNWQFLRYSVPKPKSVPITVVETTNSDEMD
jgi:hypothetical protein